MSNCIRCGATLGEFDAGGNMLCQNCEASSSGHGSGTPTDVPCQRCGMYLPPHELRMWNSRLYCAYCIMDVQDEERYGKHKHQEPVHPEGGSGSENLPQGFGKTQGTCDRCGRQSDSLYHVHGLRLCEQCYAEGGGTGAEQPSMFGQMMMKIKEAVFGKPKIVPRQPSLPSSEIRKAAPSEEKKGGAPPPPAPPPEVFDLRQRKMVQKKEGMEGERPISESARGEKKPAPKIKKVFLNLHPAAKKK